VNKISEANLRVAEARLRSFKDERLAHASLPAAKWEAVGSELRRIEAALCAGDETEFKAATGALVQLLGSTRKQAGSAGGAWRVYIGESEPPPAPVWEAFNHIVDRLQRLGSPGGDAPEAAEDERGGKGAAERKDDNR